MDQARMDEILKLCAQLSVEELEVLSKDLKKLLFRCRIQEKIENRREDVAQRISEAMSHCPDKTGDH